MTRFRKLCRWFHREFGFVAVGLTLVYGVSGLAVNHSHEWNANYSRSTETLHIEPPGRGATPELVPVVLGRLALVEPIKNTWRAKESLLQVFVEGGQYDVDLDSGEVTHRSFARRALLFDMNFMHLNSGRGVWTWIADVYAVVLILLGISGIFLVRGRKGLAGRGGVLMLAGIVLPVAYMVVMRSL